MITFTGVSLTPDNVTPITDPPMIKMLFCPVCKEVALEQYNKGNNVILCGCEENQRVEERLVPHTPKTMELLTNVAQKRARQIT